MGWFNDEHPDHEGFFVGFVRQGDSSLFRELGFPEDARVRSDVERVAIACDCGWRSPLLLAPRGTSWGPYSVLVDDELAEDLARAIWRKHVEELQALRITDGVADLHALARIKLPFATIEAMRDGDIDRKLARRAAIASSTIVAKCNCGRRYTRAAWEGLDIVSLSWTPDGVEPLEMRNCVCRSTLSVPAKPMPPQNDVAELAP